MTLGKIEKLPIRISLILGITAPIIFFIIAINAFLSSTRSTAVIGFIFLPFYCVAIFLIFAIIDFCIGIVGQGIIDRSYFRGC